MDEIGKIIDEAEKYSTEYHKIKQIIVDRTFFYKHGRWIMKCLDDLVIQLKECREENEKEKAYMENLDLQHFQEVQLIEQRTKETLKKALYSKVIKVPVTDFQYVAWRDIEQVFNEAKVGPHED